MGSKPSVVPVERKAAEAKKEDEYKFMRIPDMYKSIEEIQTVLKRKSRIENCEVNIGIDWTKSNADSGEKSFGGLNLHAVGEGIYNPYKIIIDLVSRTLRPFDNDNKYTVFGFGSYDVKGDYVFPFKWEDEKGQLKITDCDGFVEVADIYDQLAGRVLPCGPTNFAPLIRTMINLTKQRGSYQILFIITDGVIDLKKDEEDTTAAIIEASNYPISIIVCGVGDGPFDLMRKFDDDLKLSNRLPPRKFDNFQFVDTHNIIPLYKNISKVREAELARHILMEIPEQYECIKRLGLLNLRPDPTVTFPLVKFVDFTRSVTVPPMPPGGPR